jgi:hypothetical protein
MIPLPLPKKSSCPPPKRKALKIPIQDNLLDVEAAEKTVSRGYSSKITAPIYKPGQVKPDVRILVDTNKSAGLIRKIFEVDLSPDERQFLVMAAYRHNVFHYNLIADFYAHSRPEVQRLMEESALVIIDFDDALKNGFVRYTNQIAKIYAKEHEKS